MHYTSVCIIGVRGHRGPWPSLRACARTRAGPSCRVWTRLAACTPAPSRGTAPFGKARHSKQYRGCLTHPKTCNLQTSATRRQARASTQTHRSSTAALSVQAAPRKALAVR